MANLYNMNRRTLILDSPLISWKGKSFTQISSIVKKNNNTFIPNTKSANGIIFRARPLKHYRREIAVNMDLSGCHSSRVSTKIDELNRPNGSLVYNYASSALPKSLVGVNNSIDLGLPKNTTELPASCSSCNTSKNTTGAYAFSTTQNALKRVRSSGMIRKQFSPLSNKPTYYTNTAQYLISRSHTFEQNQFSYFSSGNPLAEPGTNAAVNNTYYANGTSTCGKTTPVYFKPNNPQFSQQGGVSSSSLTSRIKYDTITTSASQCSNTKLGKATANALAYGVSEQAYTLKDKLGYPTKKTPTFNAYTGALKICPVRKISREI